MTDTPKNKTLVMGQLLQIRDKLMAKRHLIPAACQAEWENIEEQTAVFDPANQGELRLSRTAFATKKSAFRGNIDDLLSMLETLRSLDRQIKLA